MKTIKLTEEAWEKLCLFKTYNKKKNFSEAIKTAIFYAVTSGKLKIGENTNDQSKK